MAFVDFAEYLDGTLKKSDVPVTSTSKVQFPTGFMYLDYGAGSFLNVYDENEVPMYTYHNIGIGKGSVNVVVAKSQGGKTTLCIEMGAAIIEPYVNMLLRERMMEGIRDPKATDAMDGLPFIQILDTEKTLSMDYVKRLVNYSNKMLQHHVRINPITTDKDLIRCLEEHAAYKASHMKKIQMPMLDIFGKPIFEYPPTIMIVDSTSQLLLEDCDDAVLSGDKKSKAARSILDIYDDNTKNTSGARRAKIITALYSQMVNYADKYNIIIFSINHINKMLPVNGIPVKQYRGLRAGETIGGGEKAIYLSASILRLDVIKNVSATGSTSVNLGDDITGHVAIASWIKSKSNSRSNTSQLVYTNIGGHDPMLSNLWMAKERGVLKESGRFLILPGMDEYKFTLKNYREVFGDHPEMIGYLYDLLRDDCEKLLDNPDHAARKEKKLLEEIRQDLSDEVNSGNYSKKDALEMDDIFSSLIND